MTVDNRTDSEWLVAINSHRQFRDQLLVIDTPLSEIKASMTHPWLCRGEDTKLYVVKFQVPNNPTHVRSYAAEQVVARLGQLIDAPVAPVFLSSCTSELLVANPLLSSFCAGVCHATSLEKVEATELRPIPLPTSQQDRDDFSKLAVLFGWCVSGDQQLLRLAVDSSTRPGGILSVDHGHFFPGALSWNRTLLAGAGPPAIDPIFVNVEHTVVDATIARLKSVTDDQIARAIAHIDPTWGVSDDDCVALADYLSRRRDIL
jgi:hypothetical protein